MLTITIAVTASSIQKANQLKLLRIAEFSSNLGCTTLYLSAIKLKVNKVHCDSKWYPFGKLFMYHLIRPVAQWWRSNANVTLRCIFFTLLLQSCDVVHALTLFSIFVYFFSFHHVKDIDLLGSCSQWICLTVIWVHLFSCGDRFCLCHCCQYSKVVRASTECFAFHSILICSFHVISEIASQFAKLIESYHAYDFKQRRFGRIFWTVRRSSVQCLFISYL